MKLIKLNATLSTNSYLKELLKAEVPMDRIVVMALDQTQGKGQHGKHWYSKAGESLTFSLYRPFSQHADVYPFMPAMAVALAVKKQLDALAIPAVSIKWPNDIMSYNKKIGGILIENIWSDGSAQHRVIGIGLNCNNKTLPELPAASSLQMLTGKTYELEELCMRLAGQIHQYFDDFRVVDQQKWYDDYLNALYKRGGVATFSVRDDEPFVALVNSVTRDGRLELLLADDSLQYYELNEIKMHY